MLLLFVAAAESYDVPQSMASQSQRSLVYGTLGAILVNPKRRRRVFGQQNAAFKSYITHIWLLLYFEV